MPPVPMTIRQAGKSEYIDGVWVPKGTLFYIAVCLSFFEILDLLNSLTAQIRVINTYKGFWGEDAEECDSLPPFSSAGIPTLTHLVDL